MPFNPFNAHFDIKVFNKQFAGLYRENSLLNHTKVPANITNSISPMVYIGHHSDGIEKKNTDFFFETDDHLTVGVEDIVSWLGMGNNNNYSVLRFDSMYFRINFTSSSWKKRLNDALIPSNYRQSE